MATTGTPAGGSGGGSSLTSQTLTNGSGTASSNAVRAATVSTFTISAANIQALGAVAAGNILVATLPAKTVVTNAYMRVTIVDILGANMTASLGRTGAAYTDYLTLAGMTEVVGTYTIGDAGAERGANLTGYDLPSYTATTDVNLRLTLSAGTLDGFGGGGSVVVHIEHYTIP